MRDQTSDVGGDPPERSWRHLFHVPEGGPYLLAQSVGCLPQSVRAHLDSAFLAPWAAHGGDAWPQWLDAIDDFRGALVTLFGGEAHQWCPQPSVSTAIASIISGIEKVPGRDVILLSEHAFPSVAYALDGLSRLGFRVEIIGGDPPDLATWQRLRDPDIAATVIMHVHSNNGIVSPVAELAKLARANGVFSIVDIAQSAGVLPISIDAWDVNAIVGTSVKWLCGGPGACFAWIAPDDVARIMPVARGWFSHTNPFEMDIHHFEFAPDARRLWGGTPSVAPFVIATAGLQTITEIGVPTIREHNLRLSARLLAQLGGLVGDVRELDALGGTLCLQLDQRHEAALQSAGARFDRRGTYLRLSFGVWNDTAEVDRIAECLQSSGPDAGAKA